MNFSHIFKMQAELDKAINSREDLKHVMPEEYKAKWLLALLVETAEFANEIQCFKYWKKHKTVDKAAVLEEFADVLHFLGSYGYKLNVDPIIEPKIVSKFPTDQILEIFRIASDTTINISKETISELIALALGCAKILGYTDDEIIEYYNLKNKKNFERVQNHY
ncbi:hypothetical protein MCAL160_0654 [Mycoplasmopsis californica HAZ160_1]|uniref:dUTPase family protein n=2 Tax=Mycoplasmopsis californica TaxID=2113 RepID=A0A059XQV4_9BACT|nr:dUTP diphosphatase [Mycoplasmopsis californica]AIA29425.1 dUTPase family protein [Mycoplasmopsis californica]BAP01126.1 hypothetical protein MCAL160_0654 [Mycoplasmopsis californica HAZ160_1]BBG40992.1 hypothetical protein MCAL106_0654 [Mycoplasmopsis californica]BBG41585.1 hypothetical protein MCAL106E_0654 [Mycoplasmopsis californica]BBG42179.1 hypothetical protein MCAL106L_0654 [Mycoplasmopsis californica]